MSADWRDDRIGSAHRGENPLVIARMRSGFAVIGDTQHLPGYSLLLTDDPTVDHLSDLDWERRTQFLFDMSLIGEAVTRACQENALRRINYEVLGNSIPHLHAHVHARANLLRELVERHVLAVAGVVESAVAVLLDQDRRWHGQDPTRLACCTASTSFVATQKRR